MTSSSSTIRLRYIYKIKKRTDRKISNYCSKFIIVFEGFFPMWILLSIQFYGYVNWWALKDSQSHAHLNCTRPY